MHHEIIRDEPGDCPKYGMHLEPMTVQAEEKNDTTHRVCSCHTSCALGWLAFLCERVSIYQNMESQYVYTHINGCRCCIYLQSCSPLFP